MSRAMDFRGRWVLVTGASSGLGREMAVQLACEHGANLVLVARRADRLEDLKTRLEAEAGVVCRVVVADLAQPADVDRVFAEATAAGPVHGVILNAGITYFGPHGELEWEGFQTLLATNVTSVVRLTNLFLPYLERQGEGSIMAVASIAGLLPVPYQAAYAGSKGFVIQFFQSLRAELAGSAVSLTVFAPGGIDTAMTRDSRLRHFVDSPFLQDAAGCAREGLAAMRGRASLHIPGRLNQAQVFASRFLPRQAVGWIARQAYRQALDPS